MAIEFTLVSTTFNEIARIDKTIADIEAQTLLPTRIIIVDAGSKDGTYDKLLTWKQTSKTNVDIVLIPKSKIAEARNHAISQATTSIVASTDFGCRYHPQWLESIITPFGDDTIEVTGGSFTVREDDVTNLAQRADYVLQNGYKTVIDDNFPASSRSIAYRKYVWERIGGYQEWLTMAADDLIFWKQIRKKNFKVCLVDKPYVYWSRHQTFKAFGKEAGRYGLGDGEGGVNKRMLMSHIIETSLRYSLFIHILLVPFYIEHTLLPLILIPFQLPGLRSYINAFKRWILWRSPKYDFKVFLAMLWMIEISRINYIRGHVKGITSRTAAQREGARRVKSELG